METDLNDWECPLQKRHLEPSMENATVLVQPAIHNPHKRKKKKRKDSILFNVFCNTLAYKISSEVAQRLPT